MMKFFSVLWLIAALVLTVLACRHILLTESTQDDAVPPCECESAAVQVPQIPEQEAAAKVKTEPASGPAQQSAPSLTDLQKQSTLSQQITGSAEMKTPPPEELPAAVAESAPQPEPQESILARLRGAIAFGVLPVLCLLMLIALLCSRQFKTVTAMCGFMLLVFWLLVWCF